MAITYENIQTETKGRVGIVRLNRPKALNALCADLVRELGQALDAFEADTGIGCIVLTGSEKAFAAGADIKEMRDKSYQDVFLQDFITVGWEKVSQIRKPIVAAVAGYALGGGCEMAMMCDFIIAADNAKFGQPEITLGTNSRRGRHAAAAALRRQVQGDGPRADRPHDGRRRSRALRPGEPGRAAGPADGRGDGCGGEDRRHVAARDDGRQGSRQPRLRDHSGRGRTLRASDLPRHFLLRRSGRRDERLRRQAQSGAHPGRRPRRARPGTRSAGSSASRAAGALVGGNRLGSSSRKVDTQDGSTPTTGTPASVSASSSSRIRPSRRLAIPRKP